MNWNELLFIKDCFVELITLCSFGVFVTGLTAELAMASLLLARKWLEKNGAYRLMDGLARMVTVSYCIPAIFILMKLRHSGAVSGVTSGMMKPREDNAFAVTDAGVFVVLGLFVIWLIGLIVRLIPIHRRNKRMTEFFKSSYAPVRMTAKLDEMRRKIDIRRRVDLKVCYGIQSPMTCGVFKTTVILPTDKYDDRELEVIFAHELTHIKRKDVLFRSILELAEVVFWFCRLIRKLHPMMTRWSETCTDIAAGKLVGGAKVYFGVITEMMMFSEVGESHHAAYMAEGETIDERIERMVRYQKEQKRKGRKIVVALVCMITVLAGSISALAAGEGVAVLSNRIYEELEVSNGNEDNVVVAVDTENGVEYVAGPRESDENVIVMNTIQELYSTFKTIGWEIPANYIGETFPFVGSNGGYIRVELEIDPTDVVVHVGIIEPSGNRRYVVANNGVVSHTFSLTAGGAYRVYVENFSQTTDITVCGGYFYE